MAAQTEINSLADLAYFPYLTETGIIDEKWQKQVGVYGIFDRERTLQYVGYSRDLYASLKQHLVRKPQQCYWLKAQTIGRPSRTILEAIAKAWIAENSTTPPGNSTDSEAWTQPIDAKTTMSDAQQQQYNQTDELGQIKLLKAVARKKEASIQQQLEARGVTLDIRFNPKLKEKGLLDLK